MFIRVGHWFQQWALGLDPLGFHECACDEVCGRSEQLWVVGVWWECGGGEVDCVWPAALLLLLHTCLDPACLLLRQHAYSHPATRTHSHLHTPPTPPTPTRLPKVRAQLSVNRKGSSTTSADLGGRVCAGSCWHVCAGSCWHMCAGGGGRHVCVRMCAWWMVVVCEVNRNRWAQTAAGWAESRLRELIN